MPTLEQYISRFMKKTRIVDSHWLWRGTTNNKSRHAAVGINGKIVVLHRFIFCVKNNLDYYDKSFLICHKQECNIPFCWNPDHLYMGDHSTNTLDVVQLGYHHNTIKIYCKYGHILNKYPDRWGKRNCPTCISIKNKKLYQARKKA